jgi:hypothetical protein
MCDAEELEDIAAFDAATEADEKTFPWEDVKNELGLNKSED